MQIPMINRVSSFLHQFSLVHQLSQMQSEMETLAREEAHFLEVTGKAISLLTARQERRGFQFQTSLQPSTRVMRDHFTA